MKNEKDNPPSWRFLEGFQVTQGGKPYLDRLRLIQVPLFGVYLHRIHMSDIGRDPHDHPWWFASLVLSGGYTETVWDNPEDIRKSRIRVRKRFSPGSISRRQAHRIDEVDGLLWTLVVTGPRRSSWGFWTAGGFVNWREYYSRTDDGYITEDAALWGGRK